MKYEYYDDVSISEEFEVYDFTSTGIKGNIEKRLKFEFVKEFDVYNLAFGDLNEDGEIDDYTISDNKDMAKILATIAFIARVFLEKYPDKTIYFRGTTIERTRLYRMAIGNNLAELLDFFEIYGVRNDSNVDLFTKNKEYFAFLVRKKI